MTLPEPFAYPEIAAGYESWYQTVGQRADWQEKALLRQMLDRFPSAHSILEVGCGTGHFTRWFKKQDLQAVGFDLSSPMLEEAKRLNSLPCVRGNALSLPFAAGAFDLVALITSLEFIPDPAQALKETIRVARKGIILGVINTQSCLAAQYKNRGGPVWDVARFFTPNELIRMIQETIGEKPDVKWRTTLWPLLPDALPLPWGGFIGMAVKLS